MREIALKYHSDLRKYRCELVAKPKNIAIEFVYRQKVITDCRTTSASKFRRRLGFKQYDIILTK